MVQNHHAVHTNKKKRNVLTRSKLLVQVSTLRENNKILAKAVAEKALRICELENAGLSYENLKLESRESIKSFRDYVLNLEALVKKAVTELAGLVNRFSGILSTTKQEKEKVEYLTSLIEVENFPGTPLELYNLRGRTVVAEETNTKCMEMKDSKLTKRTHPMNLKKSVCILETVDEKIDVNNEPHRGVGDNVGKKQSRPSISVKLDERKIKDEPCQQQNASDSCVQESNQISLSNFVEDSKELTKNDNPTLQTPIKQEETSPKINSNNECPELHETSKEGKLPECPINKPRVEPSPRKLRPRKSATHSQQVASRIGERCEGSHNICSKTVESNVDDLENKVKPQVKSARGKLIYKRSQRKCVSPLSEHQGKADTPENVSHKKELNTRSLEKVLRIDSLHPVSSKTHDARRASSSKCGSQKKYSKSPIHMFHSIDSSTQDSVKKIVSALTSPSESKLLSKNMCFDTFSEKNFECHSFPYLLSQLASDEQYITIKQEPISPKTPMSPKTTSEMIPTTKIDAKCAGGKEKFQSFW